MPDKTLESVLSLNIRYTLNDCRLKLPVNLQKRFSLVHSSMYLLAILNFYQNASSLQSLTAL